MPIDKKHIGKTYGPYRYEAGFEKMKEFAFAVGGGVPAIGYASPPEGVNPLLYDREAAKAGPHGDVVGFPSFAVTFAIVPFAAAVADPALGINLLFLVHGEQEFEFHTVVKPGDVITTTGVIKELFDKAAKDFVTVETESKNQRGELVVTGRWMAVIKHG